VNDLNATNAKDGDDIDAELKAFNADFKNADTLTKMSLAAKLSASLASIGSFVLTCVLRTLATTKLAATLFNDKWVNMQRNLSVVWSERFANACDSANFFELTASGLSYAEANAY
jgi:hypothetical protein